MTNLQGHLTLFSLFQVFTLGTLSTFLLHVYQLAWFTWPHFLCVFLLHSLASLNFYIVNRILKVGSPEFSLLQWNYVTLGLLLNHFIHRVFHLYSRDNHTILWTIKMRSCENQLLKWRFKMKIKGETIIWGYTWTYFPEPWAERCHTNARWMVGILMVIIRGNIENSVTVRHCSKNSSEVELASWPSWPSKCF